MDIRMSMLLAAVLAAGAVQAHAEKGACKADVEKFCKDVEPGEGRVIKCLKEHDQDLSEDCKAEGSKAKERLREGAKKMKAACGADMEKFCKGVEPGGGRIIQCLKEHDHDLSEGCKMMKREGAEKFRARKGEKTAWLRENCKADVEKFCKDVEPGEGRIVKCLHAHEKEVGEDCRKKFQRMGEGMKTTRERREKDSGD